MEKTLGEMLFEYRAKNHLSIKQVADMVGVSVATISNMERGHKVSRKTEQLVKWICEGVNWYDNLWKATEGSRRVKFTKE